MNNQRIIYLWTYHSLQKNGLIDCFGDRGIIHLSEKYCILKGAKVEFSMKYQDVKFTGNLTI